jgi:hypothetical protein
MVGRTCAFAMVDVRVVVRPVRACLLARSDWDGVCVWV